MNIRGVALKDFPSIYDRARTMPDLFEIVKDLVESELGHHRGGIMLAISDLGIGPEGFVGAYFTIGSNAIVVNRQALELVRSSKPSLYKPYKFHILLHEFLHSVGYIDEQTTRDLALTLSERGFGKVHPVTRIASSFDSIFGSITLPLFGYEPPRNTKIELVEGFDRSSVNYIR